MASPLRPSEAAAEAPPGRRNIALWVEYDGSSSSGWQAQDGQVTVAGALREAIGRMTGQPALPRCASRTDAGVHARGQLATFRTDAAGPARRFAPGLNHFLPPTIRVLRTWAVADRFDARRAARGKVYRYRIVVAPHAAALERGRAWHLRGALDIHAMQQAALSLVGEHDFSAFRHAHCGAGHARRHLWRLRVGRRARPPAGELVTIHLAGNAFCRHMCRILVGTLVEVGRGRRSPQSVAGTLAGRDRRRAGPTAPAEGLTLMRVLVGRRA